jgi:hypothetical protein
MRGVPSTEAATQLVGGSKYSVVVPVWKKVKFVCEGGFVSELSVAHCVGTPLASTAVGYSKAYAQPRPAIAWTLTFNSRQRSG